MNLSSPFIPRPVGTTLLTLAIALAGVVAYLVLPVSPLPQVDFPTIMVQANLPGASPETMASTVATPLERTLGRIAGIEEMTSTSIMGRTTIVLQFDLDRDIDGAARDVQAAINAARAILPTMPSNPIYRKINPADAPIMLISLYSDNIDLTTLYDLASTVLSQKLSQVLGVGQVLAVGSAKPAVRVEVNPGDLNGRGVSLQEVRAAITRSNVNSPKGFLDNGETQWFVASDDQLRKAEDFAPLIVKAQDGSIVRLSDIAKVSDGVESVRNAGVSEGKPLVLLIVFRQPGSNIIETVERVKEALPLLRTWMPEGADMKVVMDRSPSIMASLKDVEHTLGISMVLVVLVVFLFLQDGRATFIPAIAVPVSLLGTFGIMYLCGFSLNHLSLMALTIATGFVVDDAIVVTENIVRHVEEGMAPYQAALKGAKEVAFTVVSISISLVAIFIPILFMGGLAGRLFREFAVTLSTAVLVSLVISLISTPMMCAHMLRDRHGMKESRFRKGIFRRAAGGVIGAWSAFLAAMHGGYARTLATVLRHPRLTMLTLILTIVLNFYLYASVPKGFFPQQDTGQIAGSIQADQSISFQSLRTKLFQIMEIISAHPDVDFAAGYTGGSQRNAGQVFINLNPRRERQKTIDEVMFELRRNLEVVPGATLFLMAQQDIRVGGRRSASTYQYTLQSDDLNLLRDWTPRITEAFKQIPGMIGVNSDSETKGLQSTLDINRDSLARLSLNMRQVDMSLGMAFGESFASTIYTNSNQYRVVMEFSSEYQQSPESLKYLYVPAYGASQESSGRASGAARGEAGGNAGSSISAAVGAQTGIVPLSAFAKYRPTFTSLGVAHQGQYAASTVSFDLDKGYSLSDVLPRIDEAMLDLRVPDNVRGGLQGTAKAFTDSAKNQPLLILAALITLYIVLGVLYESLIHPITILSTLPSAGVGAILGLMAFGTEFSVIAFIGVLLLAGIVKKNAIMMIDFAIEARRTQGLSATEAIYQACLLRFRPIMMTTLAAIFGALPLLLSRGDGAELRTPLGITIVGGLIVSQLLTLYTTPVVYLYMDKLSKKKTMVEI